MESINNMCAGCALFNKRCTGTKNQTWTGCIYRTAPAGSYIIRIGNAWYALSMDTYAHYIFGIGADTEKLIEIKPTPGTTAGRNAAILATCSPLPTWRDAYSVARLAGNFIGQLYE